MVEMLIFWSVCVARVEANKISLSALLVTENPASLFSYSSMISSSLSHYPSTQQPSVFVCRFVSVCSGVFILPAHLAVLKCVSFIACRSIDCPPIALPAADWTLFLHASRLPAGLSSSGEEAL